MRIITAEIVKALAEKIILRQLGITYYCNIVN